MDPRRSKRKIEDEQQNSPSKQQKISPKRYYISNPDHVREISEKYQFKFENPYKNKKEVLSRTKEPVQFVDLDCYISECPKINGGLSVYAGKDYKHDPKNLKILNIYHGVKCTTNPENAYTFEYNKTNFTNAIDTGNETRCVNNSKDDYNIVPSKAVLIINGVKTEAIIYFPDKDIKKNDQLLIYYGPNYGYFEDEKYLRPSDTDEDINDYFKAHANLYADESITLFTTDEAKKLNENHTEYEIPFIVSKLDSTPHELEIYLKKEGSVIEVNQPLLALDQQKKLVPNELQPNLTPLMIASFFGNFIAVNALVSHGANINSRHAFSGRNALFYAIRNNNTETKHAIVKRLSKDIDLTAQDKNGLTAMHWCVEVNDVETLTLLIINKKKVKKIMKLVTKDHKLCPITFALAHNKRKTFDLLLKNFADDFFKDEERVKTAICKAIDMNQVNYNYFLKELENAGLNKHETIYNAIKEHISKLIIHREDIYYDEILYSDPIESNLDSQTKPSDSDDKPANPAIQHDNPPLTKQQKPNETGEMESNPTKGDEATSSTTSQPFTYATYKQYLANSNSANFILQEFSNNEKDASKPLIFCFSYNGKFETCDLYFKVNDGYIYFNDKIINSYEELAEHSKRVIQSIIQSQSKNQTTPKTQNNSMTTTQNNSTATTQNNPTPKLKINEKSKHSYADRDLEIWHGIQFIISLNTRAITITSDPHDENKIFACKTTLTYYQKKHRNEVDIRKTYDNNFVFIFKNPPSLVGLCNQLKELTNLGAKKLAKVYVEMVDESNHKKSELIELPYFFKKDYVSLEDIFKNTPLEGKEKAIAEIENAGVINIPKVKPPNPQKANSATCWVNAEFYISENPNNYPIIIKTNPPKAQQILNIRATIRLKVKSLNESRSEDEKIIMTRDTENHSLVITFTNKKLSLLEICEVLKEISRAGAKESKVFIENKNDENKMTEAPDFFDKNKIIMSEEDLFAKEQKQPISPSNRTNTNLRMFDNSLPFTFGTYQENLEKLNKINPPQYRLEMLSDNSLLILFENKKTPSLLTINENKEILFGSIVIKSQQELDNYCQRLINENSKKGISIFSP